MATMTRHNGSHAGRQTAREGKVAKTIEQKTKNVPSDWFLWAALGSIGLAAGLRAMDREEDSQFVGMWAPTLLILGMYNKLVKVHGSDPD
jgi:hypothetical protein